jgi:hypothetical protein
MLLKEIVGQPTKEVATTDRLQAEQYIPDLVEANTILIRMVKKPMLKRRTKMKTILSITLLFVAFSLSAQKADYYLNAGPTYGMTDNVNSDFGKSLGFYLSASSIQRVSKISSFAAELQFINQRTGGEGFSAVANSLNTSAYYLIDPFKFKLNFLAGAQFGYVISSKQKMEEVTINKKGANMAVFGGMGYSLKRFGISARYNHYVNGYRPIESVIMLGGTYRLNRN